MIRGLLTVITRPMPVQTDNMLYWKEISEETEETICQI